MNHLANSETIFQRAAVRKSTASPARDGRSRHCDRSRVCTCDRALSSAEGRSFHRQRMRFNVRTGSVANQGEVAISGAEGSCQYTRARARSYPSTRAHEEDTVENSRMPTRTFLYIYRHTLYIGTYFYIDTSVHICIRVCERARAHMYMHVYTRTHLGALHLAGAHIIAGIHNADVFMALTRLFLVRCRPRPTPPRPCPYPSCNHK